MDIIIDLINSHIVNPYITHQPPASPLPHAHYPWSSSYSLLRQFLVMWAFLYLSALAIYYLFATLTFSLFYLDGDKGTKGRNSARWYWDTRQMYNEIVLSTWSLGLMSGMTAVMETWILMGHGHLYTVANQYGWLYFIASPLLFLLFTDFLIYWIHRWLHHRYFYWLHKLHHHYKETTPFSAFAFHPIDGFAQSFPYHIFVLIFPMHQYLYMATLLLVGLWTVNIHDRVTLNLWGVNGAAHHTIHHTKFNYNYGQYFTWCDRVFGTYKDPLLYWPYKQAEVGEGVVEGEVVTKGKEE